MEKKKLAKRMLIFLMSFILILLSLVLVFNSQIKYSIVKMNVKNNLTENLSMEDILINQSVEATFDFDTVNYLDILTVMQSQMDDKKVPIIGKIVIPDLKINLVISKGLSDKVLLSGAGTMDQYQKMGIGNYALASHRMSQSDLLFTPLENAQAGQLIYLTDLEYIYIYEVLFCITAEDTEINYLEVSDEKNLVTLITCADMQGDKRIIVQGELNQIIKYDEAPTEISSYFNS